MLYCTELVSFYLLSKELGASESHNLQVSIPSLVENFDLLSKYCLQDKNKIIVC